MPPKKDKAAVVKTSRGKEIDVTAAAARPRRASGREPRRVAAVIPSPSKGVKRGRPSNTAPAADEDADAAEPLKKRGRPAKAASTKPTVKPPAKKAGRPSKAKAAETAGELDDDAPAPRKRGRPPKGGETTKVTGDDAAAADQLEDELVDAADDSEDATDKSKSGKRKAPANKAASSKKGVKGKAKANDAADEADSGSGKNYWLLKAEQEDREVTVNSGKVINTKFTVDDLKAKGAPEPWDGVRNMVARNNMRKMKEGDLAFFYASGGKGKNKPSITGIIQIVREHEMDHTMYDENAYGYVEPDGRGTQEDPRWSLVHVEFRKKLAVPVTLKELQKYAHPGGVLEGMQVLTNSRVSVSRVTETQWDFIVGTLVEGYVEESRQVQVESQVDGLQESDQASINGLPDGVGSDLPSDPPINGDVGASETVVEDEGEMMTAAQVADMME